MKKLLALFVILFIFAVSGYVLYSQAFLEETDTVAEDLPLGGPAEVTAADIVDTEKLRYPSLETSNFTVVAYIDPEDASSREYVEAVRGAANEYEDTVAYAIKHFPIHIHPTARDEAGAIECAGQQGFFYEYMDSLFAATEAEQAIPEETLTAVADVESLDLNTFAICRDEELFHEAVRDDALEAMALGATGVPFSVIIDDSGVVIQRIEGEISQSALILAIENAALINDAVETTIENQ